MWTTFKVLFIEFVTILLLFYSLFFWLQGRWGLSSLTRDQTCIPWIGRQSLVYWTTGEVPSHYIIFRKDTFMCSYLNCLALSYMQSSLLVVNYAVLCLVAQSCPTLFNPMDYSPQGSSVHEDSPGKNTGEGCHALLQGIFPTQDWTHVSHVVGRFFLSEPPGKPKKMRVGNLSLLYRIFLTEASNLGLLHYRQILYQLSYQGNPFPLVSSVQLLSRV